MSIPVLVVLGVIASAFTRLNAVILGRPVTVPVVLLALAVVLAAIVRVILRDGLRFYPQARRTA